LTVSIESYEKARRAIEAAGGGDFEGAKREALVAQAEKALGVALPPSYRRFLLEMGCGDINGFEILGLISDDFYHSKIPNGIWLTLNQRQELGLAPSIVLIGEAGDGAFHALDTKQLGRSGEAPVVLVSVDGKHSAKVAESFGDYLLEIVQRTI
jgi:antitoxin YobK